MSDAESSLMCFKPMLKQVNIRPSLKYNTLIQKYSPHQKEIEKKEKMQRVMSLREDRKKKDVF